MVDLEAIKARYTPEPIPPCRVCGGELSIQRMGGGEPTVWGCDGHEDDPDRPGTWRFKADRRPADEHYSRSRWTQHRQGDPDVLALVAELDASRALLQWLITNEAISTRYITFGLLGDRAEYTRLRTAYDAAVSAQDGPGRAEAGKE